MAEHRPILCGQLTSLAAQVKLPGWWSRVSTWHWCPWPVKASAFLHFIPNATEGYGSTVHPSIPPSCGAAAVTGHAQHPGDMMVLGFLYT